MNEPTSAQTISADSVAKIGAETHRLSSAFASVFGQPRTRSDEQKLVIDHLEKCAGDDGNAYRFHEGTDGICLIAAGIHRDGARSLLRVIERQVAKAAIAKREPAPKKSAKR